ncbi:CD1871A family CXXC motif-containing protein [uncultured Ruthenibacterium sp.]
MTEQKKRYLAIAILVVAVGMMAVGILRGEAQQVWMKASNICMECIGLG